MFAYHAAEVVGGGQAARRAFRARVPVVGRGRRHPRLPALPLAHWRPQYECVLRCSRAAGSTLAFVLPPIFHMILFKGQAVPLWRKVPARRVPNRSASTCSSSVLG